MKKNILTTLILIAVLLFASCDYNDLGNMRRFNMGYAGDYAVAQAQEATKNLVGIFDDMELNGSYVKGDAKIELLREKMAAVSKAVEDIKNSKDVESNMRALLNNRIAKTGSSASECNFFNMKANTSLSSIVNQMLLGTTHLPEGVTDEYSYIEEKYGFYPDITLATTPNNLLMIVTTGCTAYSYEGGTGKKRVEQLIENLSNGDQSGNEDLKRVAKDAARKMSKYIIRPMKQRYDAGYLIYADYIFTALFIDIVYTFHDLMYDMSVPMDEKIFKTDGASRIISYIGTIEYIYDVDFGIVDIINTMVGD